MCSSDLTNAKLDEYSCALLLSALDSWGKTRNSYLEITERAMNICKKYDIRPHEAMSKGFVSPYWIIQSNQDRINCIISEFNKRMIPFRKWWEDGCASMPAYSNIPRSNLENTSRISSQTLGLPFHIYLEEKDWNQIEESIERSMY